MKRIFLAVAVVVIMSGAAHAIPISLGGGAAFGTESVNLDWGNNRFDFLQNFIGVSTFFDAYFAMLAIDLMSGSYDLSGRIFKDGTVNSDGDDVSITKLDKVVSSYSATLLNLNLIGKFPLDLYGLKTARVYPMLGAGFQLAQIVQEEGLFEGTFNEMKVIFGLGGDFDVSDRVFIRFMVLPHYALTKVSTVKIVESYFVDNTGWNAHGGFGVNGHLMAGFRIGNLD